MASGGDAGGFFVARTGEKWDEKSGKSFIPVRRRAIFGVEKGIFGREKGAQGDFSGVRGAFRGSSGHHRPKNMPISASGDADF